MSTQSSQAYGQSGLASHNESINEGIPKANPYGKHSYASQRPPAISALNNPGVNQQLKQAAMIIHHSNTSGERTDKRNSPETIAQPSSGLNIQFSSHRNNSSNRLPGMPALPGKANQNSPAGLKNVLSAQIHHPPGTSDSSTS